MDEPFSEAVLRVVRAADAPVRFEEIEIGEAVYLSGLTSGIAPEGWETIRRNPVFLKAPITTPLGGGYKSLNVTIRKTLNLYANVRPSKSYAPFVASAHPGMDLVIVRENEEDLYAGIEHQQTAEVTQVLGPGLDSACPSPWKLKMVTNRGVKVYPDGAPETFCTDHWRCRFLPDGGGSVDGRDIIALLSAVLDAGFEPIKTENLYRIDGQVAYSLGQGE